MHEGLQDFGLGTITSLPKRGFRQTHDSPSTNLALLQARYGDDWFRWNQDRPTECIGIPQIYREDAHEWQRTSIAKQHCEATMADATNGFKDEYTYYLI